MEPLGVAAGHPEQARDGVFGDANEASGCPHPASVVQMVYDGLRLFLRDFRVKQRGAASFRELLATRPATQEPEAVLAIDFAHDEIALARETKPLACGVDTRESIEVGSLHAGLL
jgi:hypothetical protein